MDRRYHIEDTSGIYSPALVFFIDIIRHNIQHALSMVGGNPGRLRPHVKTHKTRELVRLELAAGITKHKCATLAEAEMLADCGVRDIMLAYPLVGPNCRRMAKLAETYPNCHFSVTADHPRAVKALSDALAPGGKTVGVFIDLDVGQHRTGIAPGPEALALAEQITQSSGLTFAGLHVYDGHNHQENPADRETAVRNLLEPVLAFRSELERKGIPAKTMVVGGTPTFPVYARLSIPGMECAPGTCFLHDNGYGSRFSDLEGFLPAALLLTRVISRPTPTRVTFDLGYKAVASDPPAGKRLILLDIPDYQAVLQNEEHLVIETPAAPRFEPGDEAWAIPTHICPTCAMHRQAYVIDQGRLTGTWDIVARDRFLSI